MNWKDFLNGLVNLAIVGLITVVVVVGGGIGYFAFLLIRELWRRVLQ